MADNYLNMDELRKQIDEIDEQLVHLMAKRFALVKEVKLIKQASGKPAFDDSRWKHIKKRIEQLSSEEKLNPQAVQKIFDAIHDYALNQVYRD